MGKGMREEVDARKEMLQKSDSHKIWHVLVPANSSAQDGLAHPHRRRIRQVSMPSGKPKKF